MKAIRDNMGVQQTEREKKQRDIFDRFMVSTAYGNHQCRHKSEKKATPWQQTGLSVGSLLTGGG